MAAASDGTGAPRIAVGGRRSRSEGRATIAVVDSTDRDPVDTLTPTPQADPRLDAAQIEAQGDMPAAELRAALHATADLVADYLERVERYAVLPPVRPGELRDRLDGPPPETPEPLADILRDVEADVVPNVTHWQHPGYLAYFPSSASAIGILGELVTSGLNANAFLWRTSPVGAELEGITVDWLRQGLGLPGEFDGVYNDTASTSSLAALAAARQQATGQASQAGLRASPPLRIYASTDAHSSIERAAMHPRHRPARRACHPRGRTPCHAAGRAGACHRRGSGGWLAAGGRRGHGGHHVDHGRGPGRGHRRRLHAPKASGCTSMRRTPAPWRCSQRCVITSRAGSAPHSIVVNPHKWLFTPFDCSLLLTRRIEVLRDALSLVPEYLRTTGGREAGRDYSEYIPQLGRRARGIKMWMLLRYFGLDGLRARLRSHLVMAHELALTVEAAPDAELMAPVPFGLVCFRWRPARLAGREAEPADRGCPRPAQRAAP